jgi:two-component system cell cycle response regulator CpdR
MALSSVRILLVEDDVTLCNLLSKTLCDAGYTVAHFHEAMGAYAYLSEEPCALLVTDIIMSGMDGIELARRAKELDPDIKVMFITGFAAVALNPNAQAPMDAELLSKPFHLRDLVHAVDALLSEEIEPRLLELAEP